MSKILRLLLFNSMAEIYSPEAKNCVFSYTLQKPKKSKIKFVPITSPKKKERQ